MTTHPKIIPCLLRSETFHIRCSQALFHTFNSLTYNITIHNISLPLPQISPHPHSTHTMASTKPTTIQTSIPSAKMAIPMALLLDLAGQLGLAVEARGSQVRPPSWDLLMAPHYNSNKFGNRHGEAVWLEGARTH